jgi:hypothetical protein
MKADIMTKPLEKRKFEKFRKDFGIFSGHHEKVCWNWQDDPDNLREGSAIWSNE